MILEVIFGGMVIGVVSWVSIAVYFANRSKK